MKKFLAVDGGGTKTELILFGEDLKIIKHFRTGPTNFNEKPDLAAENLSATLRGIEADAVFAGIAGAFNCRDAIADVFKRAAFPLVRIESDLMNITQAELGDRDGCCVICGTGSACLAKRGAEYKRIGGWGYLIDTGGSGFDIGRDGLNAVLQSIDGRGSETCINKLFENCYHSSPVSMLTEIYSKGKSFIAGLSTLVFEAAVLGDRIALEIIDRNMSALAESIYAAGQFIGSECFMAVLTGGVFEHQAYAREALSRFAPPEVKLHFSTLPQICGAAIGARSMLGLKTTPEQRNILLEEYHALSGLREFVDGGGQSKKL